MPSTDPVTEFRTAWLPHISDDGLARLVELLEKASPLLIHGTFTRAMPMGCLASHIGWNHCATAHLQHEAGVMWLCRVAKLNPATSAVILAWDRAGVGDFELRTVLLEACLEEADCRSGIPTDDENGTSGSAIPFSSDRNRRIHHARSPVV